MDIMDLVCQDSVLRKISETLTLECSNNSLWTTSLQENVLSLPVESKTTKSTLILLRRDSETFFLSLNTSTLEKPLNISVENIEPGLKLQLLKSLLLSSHAH